MGKNEAVFFNPPKLFVFFSQKEMKETWVPMEYLI